MRGIEEWFTSERLQMNLRETRSDISASLGMYCVLTKIPAPRIAIRGAILCNCICAVRTIQYNACNFGNSRLGDLKSFGFAFQNFLFWRNFRKERCVENLREGDTWALGEEWLNLFNDIITYFIRRSHCVILIQIRNLAGPVGKPSKTNIWSSCIFKPRIKYLEFNHLFNH